MLFTELPPMPPVLEASAFDLGRIGREADGVDLRTIGPRCPAGRAGEIVVCAPDPEKQRAKPLPDAYAVTEGLPRAEINLGDGVSMDVHLDSETMPNGYMAKRVMVGVKFKF